MGSLRNDNKNDSQISYGQTINHDSLKAPRHPRIDVIVKTSMQPAFILLCQIIHQTS